MIVTSTVWVDNADNVTTSVLINCHEYNYFPVHRVNDFEELPNYQRLSRNWFSSLGTPSYVFIQICKLYLMTYYTEMALSLDKQLNTLYSWQSLLINLCSILKDCTCTFLALLTVHDVLHSWYVNYSSLHIDLAFIIRNCMDSAMWRSNWHFYPLIKPITHD